VILLFPSHIPNLIHHREEIMTQIWKDKIMEKNINVSSEKGRACVIGLHTGNAEIKVPFSTVC